MSIFSLGRLRLETWILEDPAIMCCFALQFALKTRLLKSKKKKKLLDMPKHL